MSSESNFYREIQKHSSLLASSIKTVLDTSYSRVFLETICTPFIEEVLYSIGQNKDHFNLSSERPIFYNIEEFYDFFKPEMPIAGGWSFDIEWEAGDYDFITSYPINIYEKIIYTIFGISYLQLRNKESKEKIFKPSQRHLRLKLKEIINSQQNVLPRNIADLIPYTLFEGLIERRNHINYPSTQVIWLDLYFNEDYLFYLAHLKEQGSLVISQPHGAPGTVTSTLFGNEVADMVLSDEYFTPLWTGKNKAFPHLRVSRSLFLNLKDSYRSLFNKKKSKLLVVIGFIYMKGEPNYMKAQLKEGLIYNFTQKKIKELGQHFSSHFDFKLHSNQSIPKHCPVEGLLEIEALLKQLYPSSEVIKGGILREIAHDYNGIISLDYYGTCLLEFSATNIKTYVYLGPECAINKEYESLLWDTRRSSTRDSIADGTYVEMNNKKLKEAYGASYFYPFYFSLLIRKLMAQFRKVKLSQQPGANDVR